MTTRRFHLPEWLILLGGAFFIVSLAVSALFVPEIRALHVVQAFMYVAIILLSARRNRWGYFIGAATAGFWNLTALFGSVLFAELIAHPSRPDLVLQGLAWLANFALVSGSVLGYRRLSTAPADAGRFALAFAASTAFLIAATAALAPAYLPNLAGLLHPHWPWVRP
jgi:hypothetical protein